MKSIKEILDEQRDGDDNGNPSKDKKKGISRRNLLLWGGVAVVGAGIAFREEIVETITGKRKEANESSESFITFKLGPTKFFISQNEFNKEETKILVENMLEAYDKLSLYFGEEVLMANNSDHPGIMVTKGCEECAGGGVKTYGIIQLEAERINPNDPNIRETVKTGVPIHDSLGIDDIRDKSTILHEMCHLMVQWCLDSHSEAFFEGHAQVIEKILYPDEQSYGLEDFHGEYTDQFNSYLDENGWDITVNDQNETIEFNSNAAVFFEMLKSKWRKAWLKLLEKDPDFLKKYYRKIAMHKKEKGKGAIVIGKYEDQIEIAKKVSPHFEDWYNNEGRSIQLPDKNNPSKLFVVKKLSEGDIFMANISAPHAKGKKNSTYYGPAIPNVNIIGTCNDCDELCQNNKITCLEPNKDSSDKRKTISILIDLEENEPLFGTIRIPPEMDVESIEYNGKKYPLLPLEDVVEGEVVDEGKDEEEKK